MIRIIKSVIFSIFIFSFTSTASDMIASDVEQIKEQSEQLKKLIELYDNKERKIENILVDGGDAKIFYDARELDDWIPSGHVMVRSLVTGKAGSLSASRDFVVLDKAGKIISLNFSPDSIDEIKLLSSFDRLKYLFLYRSEVKGELNLVELKYLEHLELLFSGFESLNLPKNNDLRYLRLVRNEISRISNLGDMKGLEDILLVSSKLTSLADLTNSKNLKRMVVSGRNKELKSLPDFKSTPNLEVLFFSSQYVKDVEGVDNLKKIKALSTGSYFD